VDENLNALAASSTGQLDGVAVPSAGQYAVLVLPGSGAAADDYTLTWSGSVPVVATSAEPVDSGPQSITIGQSVTGVIDDQTPSRLYTFEGSAGDTVRLLMEATDGSELDCYLELQDSAGGVIDANDDIIPGQNRNSEIVTELPVEGTYLIVASRYVGSDAPFTSGAFELTVEQQEATAGSAGTQVVPLTYDQSAVGEITSDQYLAFFVFNGNAADVVTISIDHLSGNLDSVLYLYQAVSDDWVLVASNDDSPLGGTYEALLVDIILPQTGKYLIAVTRYGLDAGSTEGQFSVAVTVEAQ
ncbi:MAG: hypothetical protein GYB65_01980, partial [Chloroflexi bacterium]|nr:hypothetical protein [Chloroflexota bacterium]